MNTNTYIMEETVTCLICNRKFKQLSGHLKKKHGITGDEYKKMFLDAPLMSELLIYNNSNWHKEYFKNKENHPMYNKHHSDEAKLKISIANTGKIPNNEAKLKMSIAGKGKKKSEDHKRKIGEGNKGRKCTDKTKQKMSDNHTDVNGENNPFYGKSHTKEMKEYLSFIKIDKFIGENNPNWKGGISFDPYCEKFNNTKKKEVRDKYNNCDYLTGIHRDICNVINGKVQELTVHHVDFNKLQGCNGYKWLLVPVSKRHNAMFNFNRSFWKRLILYTLKYDKEYYKEVNIWQQE